LSGGFLRGTLFYLALHGIAFLSLTGIAGGLRFLFNGDDFLKFIGKMPYIIIMRFNGDSLEEMEEIEIG
jgi:hypothetical protein